MNLNRRRKRETRNQKTDLPRKVYLTIQLSEYNPSLIPTPKCVGTDENSGESDKTESASLDVLPAHF